MQPNVPIPTDNLYKFLATFGLALIVAAMVGLFVIHKSSNDEIFTVAEMMFAIGKDGTDKTDVGKDMMSVYEKRIDIVASNRQVGTGALVLIFGIGWTFALIGFQRWAKIQPLHDELLELQVAKARKEVHGSNVYRELPKRPEVKKPAKKAK
ncbi:hypothetical protein [Stenotrophomonas sp.]|uniref:hypothetical protein n=1 Tax=Stenotrophomonas sp. TaxID=69392 RepID=UPI0028B1B4EB|nr:hypothetical protein [Stenotrophomonas sp.]